MLKQYQYEDCVENVGTSNLTMSSILNGHLCIQIEKYEQIQKTAILQTKYLHYTTFQGNHVFLN